MGDFTLYVRKGDSESHRFVFRISVPSYECESDWIKAEREVRAWGRNNRIRLRITGQCVIMPRGTADYENAALAFKLRWC